MASAKSCTGITRVIITLSLIHIYRAIVKSRVYQTTPQKERVMLLGHGDLAELEALTLTAGGEICARVVQKNKPLGEGKLKQAALEAQAARAQLIIYDGELSLSLIHI